VAVYGFTCKDWRTEFAVRQQRRLAGCARRRRPV